MVHAELGESDSIPVGADYISGEIYVLRGLQDALKYLGELAEPEPVVKEVG